MGFKLPGKSMTSGTSGHSSALKMKEQADAASALKDLGHGGHPGMTKSEAAAADHGGGDKMSDERIALRKKAKTPKQYTEDKKPYVKPGGKATKNMKDLPLGSKERYAEYESRGWKHDDTTKGGEPATSATTKDTRGGKKVTKVTDTKDYTKTSKFKGSGKEGEGATVSGVVGVRKAKTKTKYKEGDRDVKLKTKYDKSGEITKQKTTIKEGDKVTKTITKGTGDDVTKRVKTRKRGGTGLGSYLKKRKARRAARKATE